MSPCWRGRRIFLLAVPSPRLLAPAQPGFRAFRRGPSAFPVVRAPGSIPGRLLRSPPGRRDLDRADPDFGPVRPVLPGHASAPPLVLPVSSGRLAPRLPAGPGGGAVGTDAGPLPERSGGGEAPLTACGETQLSALTRVPPPAVNAAAAAAFRPGADQPEALLTEGFVRLPSLQRAHDTPNHLKDGNLLGPEIWHLCFPRSVLHLLVAEYKNIFLCFQDTPTTTNCKVRIASRASNQPRRFRTPPNPRAAAWRSASDLRIYRIKSVTCSNCRRLGAIRPPWPPGRPQRLENPRATSLAVPNPNYKIDRKRPNYG